MERFLGWFVPRTPVQDSCSLEPTWVALVWHPPSTALFDPHHVGGDGVVAPGCPPAALPAGCHLLGSARSPLMLGKMEAGGEGGHRG